MKCALCGYRFGKQETNLSCKGCPIAKGCKLIKCPNCGYEILPEPKWLKKILERKSKNGID